MIIIKGSEESRRLCLTNINQDKTQEGKHSSKKNKHNKQRHRIKTGIGIRILPRRKLLKRNNPVKMKKTIGNLILTTNMFREGTA